MFNSILIQGHASVVSCYLETTQIAQRVQTPQRSYYVLILPVVNELTPILLCHKLQIDHDVLQILLRVKCVQISTRAGP